jgi:hypothetical protein
MKTKEQIAVKQFKKSEMGSMDEKSFKKAFVRGSQNAVKLAGDDSIYADAYELWDNGQVGLLYDNRYIARISLSKIKEVF